ncbi:hypothetical protein EZMO1_1524 [Endozoicomonas montiporae CL-33]|uniref:Uncharacterized protein n=1 Tax=Endozoicomonas montiporae CL-33 TaxID=570277 RepID=A0A142BAB4_9GAMM|nr:hypothetical protein EZMO1_1524 [Endozoicomonas montiporae CL-33]
MSLCLSEKFIQNVSFGLKVVCCKSEKWFTLQQGIRLKAYICRELLALCYYTALVYK